MIKLIASDLDGTLLQESREVSGRMLQLIPKLKANGILFAAASGRQYHSLKNLFSPVWEDMLFICENGALIMQGDKPLFVDQIPREWGLELMNEILDQPGCEVLLSGKDQCYLCPKTEEYVKHMTDFVKNKVKLVDSFSSVQENFIKISLYLSSGISEELAQKFTEEWEDRFTVAVAGDCWIDFTLSNKGSSLTKIGSMLDIRPEEMLVFGDHFNDREMFAYAGVSYAMNSAQPEVKKLAKFTCDRVEPIVEEVLKSRLNSF